MTVMKMKSIWVAMLLTVISFGMGSCTKDDLDDIRKELQEHDDRLTSLEEWQKSVNTNISSLQSLVEALEGKDYVTEVTPLADGSGYEISFLKSGTITIKHGEKGDDGNTPVISVKQDTDEKYYWTVNGEWLLDGDNNKMPVTGEKGDDGETPYIGNNGNWWVGTTDTGVKAQGNTGDDGLTPHIGDNGNWWIGTTDTGVKAQGEQGDPGTSAIAPQVRINADTNEWEISTDGGQIWTSTGVKATGSNGDSFFEYVTVDEQAGYIEIKIQEEDAFRIPFFQNRLTFALNGTTLTDLTSQILVLKDELTFSAPEDMQVSVRVLDGKDWSATIEGNTIKMMAGNGPAAVLEVALTDNGKVIETYRLNLSLFAGRGTTGDPYLITSSEEFIALSEQTNVDTTYANTCFKLTNDIDLTNTDFKPFHVFAGSFNGQGNTVRGLNIVDNAQYTHIGMFRQLNGALSNLNVEGTVHKVRKAEEQTSSIHAIGGIVAINNGTVKNCTFKGNVTSDVNDFWDYIGGVIGVVQNNGVVEGCAYLASADGKIDVDRAQSTGGVVGWCNAGSHVIGCYNTGGIVYGNTAGSVGGVVGTVYEGTVACYNTGTITVPAEMRGAAGINGNATWDTNIITACYDAADNNEDVYAIGASGTALELMPAARYNTCYWLKADNRIGIGYTGRSSSKDLYKDIPFIDCTAKDGTELKSQTAVDALNAAIATWNETHNNRCTYLFEVDANGGYPVLVAQD